MANNTPKFSWSEITCGHSCWYAKEDECKCSCGGKNHGCLLVEGNEQPTRTKKVGRHLYYLQIIGNRIQLLDVIDSILPDFTGEANATSSWFKYNPAKAGNPFMMNYATFEQAQKWNELSQYKEIAKDDFYFESPAILWRREDVPASLFD